MAHASIAVVIPATRRPPADPRFASVMHEPFGPLHNRYRGDLLRALRRRFGADHDGLEDAVQTAFTRFRELKDRAVITNPRAFLLVMARNLVLDRVRRADLGRRNIEHEIQAPTVPIVEERTPETVLLEKERFARLNQAVLDLPEKQRRLLVMSRIDGMTYAEISRLTGRSFADISRQIASAMAALHARLDDSQDKGGA
jgi:RNA polymerase sigma factor (sigma-70 family)